MDHVTAPTPAAARAAGPRPTISAGAVIGRSFSLWARHLPSYAGVAVLIGAPVLVLVAVAGPFEPTSSADRLTTLLGNLLGTIATGPITVGVLRGLRGERVRIAEMLRSGLARIGVVVFTSIGVGLLVLLGTLLLVVPGIVAAVGLWVAVPAAVVERELGSTGALRRSWRLTEGTRLAIFLVALVMWLTVLGGLSLAVAVASAAGGVLPATAALGTEIVSMVLTSLLATSSAVAYHDLRVAREGVATADLVKVFE
jgi:hypothetical protein